jgi:hypothetical protein
MRKDILTANQIRLLPLIREFSREYYLVGGTAIALYLGHRRSILTEKQDFIPFAAMI